VGRTIYEQQGDGPSDGDVLIGVMDTPELAAEACRCHNAMLAGDAGYGNVTAPEERKAVRTGTAAALRLAGLRDEVHPHDAMAFIYPDRAYFERSAARDRELLRNDVHGPYETPEGLLGIVDIRPQLRERGLRATDPELPDDWTPPRVRRGT